jgi:MFS family permease
MAIIPGNTHKLCALWFKKGLGLANSIIGLGGGVGSVLSAVLTASVLSPLLGGWNHVLYLYGALLVAVGIPILLLRAPSHIATAADTDSEDKIPPLQAISHVMRNRNVWLLGLTFMGLWGGAMGVMGYLPLYLRGIGWSPVTADSVLAVAGFAAMVGALPLGFATDRIGLRKPFLLAAVLSTSIGIGLLLIGGVSVWASAIFMGLFRTVMQSIIMTSVAETEGIGRKYAGTGIGVTFTLSYVGSIFSPIIGNSLATINPNFAFIFWTSLALVPLLFSFPFLKETGWRTKQLK